MSRIIERCLQKQPAARYANAVALADDLAAITAGSRPSRRVPLIATAIAGLAALALAVTALDPPSSSDASEPKAVPTTPLVLAVLPFGSEGGSGANPYIADALTAELAARLSTVRGVRVLASSSLSNYLQAAGSADAIAASLGADALLSGTVEPRRDSVRVTATLVGANGQMLWNGEYQASGTDALAVQEDVGRNVLAVLTLESDGSHSFADAGTNDPTAYDAYLRGRYYWNRRDAQNLRLALTQFRAALDLDPLFARAWAGLAESYDMLASTDVLPTAETVPIARAAADRALDIDPDLAEAHTALATIFVTYELDWEGAERHFRRALESNPSYITAHQRYAALLQSLGRVEEGLIEARRALELEPLSSYARAAVGYALYLARRYDEAIAHLRTTRTVDPGFGLTYVNLGLAQLAAGRTADAVTTLEALDSLWADAPVAVSLLGLAYARSGRIDDAGAMLQRLRAIATRQPVSSFHFAPLHLGLGDDDAAIARWMPQYLSAPARQLSQRRPGIR